MNTPCKYECKYAKENKFLRQWRDEVMESFGRYDSDSVEEVYQNGINRGVNMLFKAICDYDVVVERDKYNVLCLLKDKMENMAKEMTKGE